MAMLRIGAPGRLPTVTSSTLRDNAPGFACYYSLRRVYAIGTAWLSSFFTLSSRLFSKRIAPVLQPHLFGIFFVTGEVTGVRLYYYTINEGKVW